jgi:murein DD-endopeptidase MepM/ murein hydrolase activator NlpD
MQRHDIQLRIQKGMEVLPADVRKLGVGGPAVGSPEMIELLQIRSPYYKKASQLTRTIDELQRKTQYQQESFVEIDRKLKKDDYIRDHTPSIAPAAGYLTSGFGYRIDPFLYCPKMHPGVDIANSSGTPIVATADGTVTFAESIPGYGLMIKIDHGNQIETRYGHLSAIYIKPGQRVLRGDVIGGMGNTGRSTGTHLHYEVRIAGKAVNPINYLLSKENSRQIGF